MLRVRASGPFLGHRLGVYVCGSDVSTEDLDSGGIGADTLGELGIVETSGQFGGIWRFGFAGLRRVYSSRESTASFMA